MNRAEEHPYTLVAELTYRCPLRCLYCSNPVALGAAGGTELTTAEWARVFAEADSMGVMQVNLSGGEPLARPDLEALIGAAGSRGLYVNLITSAAGLTRERLARLRAAGLDAVQISFQDVDAAEAAHMAGRDMMDRKRNAAGWARELGVPLTVNVVLHRGNLDRVDAIIAMAEAMGADRLELANAQYLGWALANRDRLLPDGAALDRARAVVAAARPRLQGRMELLFVLPDYHADKPKACMDGWGRHYLVVNPYGWVLPCHAAAGLPDPGFVNARALPLETIWSDSRGFNAFRGESWMSPVCRTCDHRGEDFGGCRCQAFHLTGDASAADPACAKSPHHGVVLAARERAVAPAVLPEPVYRNFPSVGLTSS